MSDNVIQLVPDVQVVVLDCPIETWHERETRELFAAMVQLKIDGYGAEYSHRALPLDASDWFGTHVLIVQKDPAPRVILGYKISTVERCEEYNQAFPALSIPIASGAESHRIRVQQIMEDCKRSGKSIGYLASWTIHPEIRENRVFTSLLRELVVSTHLEFQASFGVEEMLICGMLRFKTDLYLEKIGAEPLSLNGQELPSFNHKSLNGEPARLLHLKRCSEMANSYFEKHREYWAKRKTLIAPDRFAQNKMAIEKKKAA